MNVNYEKFNCPICFLLPEKEIYQCKNGHILCDKCIATLQQCPQCRVSIRGNRKSRNRALEEILDDLKIDCPFSNHGCLKKVGRSDLEAHRSSCIFGKRIPLCRLLSDVDCNFTVTTTRNLKEVVIHMEAVHGKEYCSSENEGRVMLGECLLEFFKPGNVIFFRVLQFKDLQLDILFVAIIKEEFVSWVCLDLNESEWESGSKMRIKIWSEQTPTTSWTVPVFPVMEAEEHFKDPMVKTFMPSLRRVREQVESGNFDYIINFELFV